MFLNKTMICMCIIFFNSSLFFAQDVWQGDAYPLDYCIITGKTLSDIKKPVSYDYKGQDVKFYDEDALVKFKENPSKYINLINHKIVAQQVASYPLQECIVTGDILEEPINIVYKNRLLRLCCKGCIKDFDKDPMQYIHKLNKVVIEQQKPLYARTNCLVMEDEELGNGSMGEPVDFVHANHLVRFCCKGCIKKFRRNPTKFMERMQESGGHDNHNHGDHNNKNDHDSKNNHNQHNHDH